MDHRHAIDCPGGNLCFCGVSPDIPERIILPRPKRVEVRPHPAPEKERLASGAHNSRPGHQRA